MRYEVSNFTNDDETAEFTDRREAEEFCLSTNGCLQVYDSNGDLIEQLSAFDGEWEWSN